MRNQARLLCFFAAITVLAMGAAIAAAQSGDTPTPAPSYALEDGGPYFREMTGCAVFFSEADNTCYIYNRELAETESAPNSTFKILSCLMGLESGAIDPGQSVIPWDGFEYPIAAWNRDLDFRQAFKASAIWYYRKVIDRIGRDFVQSTLDRLSYGNCDISRWEGGGNRYFPDIRDMPSVNGFWQESSLQISPVNQVAVLRKIFRENDGFDPANVALLREVMLQDTGIDCLKLYGKTGTGVRDETSTNAWFVGFYTYGGDTVYFAVRENEPGTTGQAAKDIALRIIRDLLSDP